MASFIALFALQLRNFCVFAIKQSDFYLRVFCQGRKPPITLDGSGRGLIFRLAKLASHLVPKNVISIGQLTGFLYLVNKCIKECYVIALVVKDVDIFFFRSFPHSVASPSLSSFSFISYYVIQRNAKALSQYGGICPTCN